MGANMEGIDECHFLKRLSLFQWTDLEDRGITSSKSRNMLILAISILERLAKLSDTAFLIVKMVRVSLMWVVTLAEG